MGESPNQGEDPVRRALDRLLEELPALLSQFDHRGFWMPGGSDELRQRVATAALGSLPQFKPSDDLVGSLRGWLVGIARHTHGTLAREHYRAIEAVEDAVLDQARADKFSPSRLMAKEEAFAALQGCLLKLSEMERTLLIRRYVDKHPAAQVAADLGLTEHQLDHRTRNAKEELRKCWGSSGAYRFIAGGA